MKNNLSLKLEKWSCAYKGKVYANPHTPINERIHNKSKISLEELKNEKRISRN